jgi:microcystin-dependent protein
VVQPYVGEIRMFAGNFAPTGWMFCQGQTLPINEYEVLFTLIGTTYGGDGQATFMLPNFQSRFPVHTDGSIGGTFSLGQTGGVEEVALTIGQLPAHSHQPAASSDIGTTASPANAVWAAAPDTPFTDNGPDVTMRSVTLAPVGNGGAHENLPPYLAVNFIIATTGVFPSQT